MKNIRIATFALAAAKVVEFEIDKARIFRIYFPIHPGHVGGQFLVLE